MVNLSVKHGIDERVLVDDLHFQVLAARSIAYRVGETPRELFVSSSPAA